MEKGSNLPGGTTPRPQPCLSTGTWFE